MIFHQYIPSNQKIPLSTKVYLVLWIILSLALLFIFTFTFFIGAIIVGILVMAVNFFRKPPEGIRPDGSSILNPTRIYQRPRSRDDDVIDI